MKKSDTVVTEYVEFCLICGKPYNIEGHHLICGKGRRQKGTEDKLLLPVCSDCHKRIHGDGVSMALSKMVGQAIYEQNHTREEFKGEIWTIIFLKLKEIFTKDIVSRG